jgi:signal peptidase II
MLGKWILMTLSVSVCIWLCVLTFNTKEIHEKTAFSLIIGGALGNVTDRVIYSGVVDFIDIHLNKHHWPAFNIADSAIVLGVGLIFCMQAWHAIRNRSSIKK